MYRILCVYVYIHKFFVGSLCAESCPGSFLCTVRCLESHLCAGCFLCKVFKVICVSVCQYLCARFCCVQLQGSLCARFFCVHLQVFCMCVGLCIWGMFVCRVLCKFLFMHSTLCAGHFLFVCTVLYVHWLGVGAANFLCPGFCCVQVLFAKSLFVWDIFFCFSVAPYNIHPHTKVVDCTCEICARFSFFNFISYQNL